MLMNNSCQFYFKKEIDLNTCKINIEYPFEPHLEKKTDVLFTSYQCEYAYPDYSYENYMYGMMIIDFNVSYLTSDIIEHTISDLKKRYVEQLKGKLISDKSIIFQNYKARELKFQVINHDNNDEFIITGVYFTYKNNLIQFYVHSPLPDSLSPLNVKSAKSLDYFFKSFEIK
jgi:hypothetical protein